MNLKSRVYETGESWIDDMDNICTVRPNGTVHVLTVNDLPTLTIQSEKDACDVNKIVERFKTTGIMTNVRKDSPMYGDFSNISDYQSAVIAMQNAEESFMSLPADIRKRFANDPGKLIEFLENPENRSEAIKLRLIEGQVEDEVVAPPPVSDPAGPSSS